MAYTHVLKKGDGSEYLGVYYRYKGSNYWKYPARLYDGDENTMPTNHDGYVILKLDMSWLPKGMVLTGVTARYLYQRAGSSMPDMALSYSNNDTYTAGTCKDLFRMEFPNGNYNTKEWHGTLAEITPEQSETYMNAKYQLLSVGGGSSSKAYEIELRFTYEEANDSKIYAGEAKAKSVYVGTTKAKAVYIGTKKVL